MNEWIINLRKEAKGFLPPEQIPKYFTIKRFKKYYKKGFSPEVTMKIHRKEVDEIFLFRLIISIIKDFKIENYLG